MECFAGLKFLVLEGLLAAGIHTEMVGMLKESTSLIPTIYPLV